MYFLGSRMMADELLIFSGTANAELTVAIASFLILRAQRFPDRKIPFEISFKLRMPLESTEVFPVQSFSSLPESNVVELPAPVDAYHARIAAGHAHLPGTRPRSDQQWAPASSDYSRNVENRGRWLALQAIGDRAI
jgi:hypothetical protein